MASLASVCGSRHGVGLKTFLASDGVDQLHGRGPEKIQKLLVTTSVALVPNSFLLLLVRHLLLLVRHLFLIASCYY